MPKSYVSKWFSKKGELVILPYGGYANASRFYGIARVLEDMGVQHTINDGVYKNLWNTYKRFETDEIHNAQVLARWENGEHTISSDKEGYTYLDVLHNLTINQDTIEWLPLSYEIQVKNKPLVKVDTQIMKPGSLAQFGVITDIDDTLLVTGVSSRFKWKMIVNSTMVSSFKRRHFPSADVLYHTLNKGQTNQAINPIFYLSNSPWNMYDYLVSFLEYKKFPKGPIILRDYGAEHRARKSWRKSNKFLQAQRILKTYPHLPFILIGDAGELDARIYLELAKEFKERVSHIFIREVPKRSSNKRVRKLIKRHNANNMHLFKHSNDVLKILGLKTA